MDSDSEHIVESIGSNSCQSQSQKEHTSGKRKRETVTGSSAASSFFVVHAKCPASRGEAHKKLASDEARAPVAYIPCDVMDSPCYRLAMILRCYNLPSELEAQMLLAITKNGALFPWILESDEPARFAWLKSISAAGVFERWHEKWIARHQKLRPNNA